MFNILRRLLVVVLCVVLLTGCAHEWIIIPKEGETVAYISNWLSKDAKVYKLEPDANYGSTTNLLIGQQNTNNDYQHRAFLGFDLSSFPEGATVTFAGLAIYSYGITGQTTALTFDAYRVTGSWDESTITWNNQPAVEASPTVTGLTCPDGSSSELTFRYFEITDLVAELIANGDDSIMLRAQDETENYTIKGFSSSEASSLPYLYIEYAFPIKLAASEGSIDKTAEAKYIANTEGSIDKAIVGMKIAVTEGSIDKTVF